MPPIIERKIVELFNAITKIGVDPSPLKSRVEKYMESVDHLDAVRRTHFVKISLEVQNERLAIVASQIVDALNSEGIQVNCRQLLKVDLTTLNPKQESLKKELEQLGIQKEHLHNSILEIDEIIANK